MVQDGVLATSVCVAYSYKPSGKACPYRIVYSVPAGQHYALTAVLVAW